MAEDCTHERAAAAAGSAAAAGPLTVATASGSSLGAALLLLMWAVVAPCAVTVAGWALGQWALLAAAHWPLGTPGESRTPQSRGAPRLLPRRLTGVPLCIPLQAPTSRTSST